MSVKDSDSVVVVSSVVSEVSVVSVVSVVDSVVGSVVVVVVVSSVVNLALRSLSFVLHAEKRNATDTIKATILQERRCAPESAFALNISQYLLKLVSRSVPI